MEKITSFLKANWWIWLILLAISSLFLIFGVSAIRLFLGNVISSILLMALIALIWAYTFDRGQTKSWGIFRILGIIGCFLFTFVLIIVPFDEGKNNLREAMINPFFNTLSLGLIFSLIFFVLGEIFLYLDNIQILIKSIADRAFTQKEDSVNMTCPRCYGKGFVDLNDVKRLGMENKWGQGFCRYCDGQGEVEKGKTKELNPLRTDIGPSWHDSDIL
jgi:hypothetical protein